MLSKSQARGFFVGGTAFFSLIFVFLTLDTLREIPARQRSEALTPAVVRGKDIWETNNCMGCHTILGEGAYYAPELTRVVERRGKQWIALFLKDPAAMYPGQRKMVQYDFSADQIADVIAFLDWIGQIDTNGFPPEPDLRPAAAPVVAAVDVRPPPDYFGQVCTACHAVAGKGGVAGPALDGVGARMSRAELDRWLANPAAVKPGTAMPNLGLSDPLRGELVDWLASLR